MTKIAAPDLALCAADALPGFGAGFIIALNSAADEPDWVQLLPRGPVLSGLDGRSWTLDGGAGGKTIAHDGWLAKIARLARGVLALVGFHRADQN